MAKKMNPLIGIVGGLLAVIILFSLIAIVLYPAAPTNVDDHSPDAPQDNKQTNSTDGNTNEFCTAEDKASEPDNYAPDSLF